MKNEGMELLDFQRLFFADREDLVGARWWQESVDAWVASTIPQTSRRGLIITVGGVFAAGIIAPFAIRACNDDDAISVDSLEAQRKHGWNVGASPSEALTFEWFVALDAAERSDWNLDLVGLGPALAPAQASLLPFYVPTLFQSLAAVDLRQTLKPILSPDMISGRMQGAALADLFRRSDREADTALLIDVPGPTAVAVAAGLADNFEPVFLFDNWPHPRGVVPSHRVLAAAVYYRPVFERERARRREGSPPAFVIDSLRLSHYQDDSNAFDNRYVAKLPGPESFKQLGVKRLFYVSDTGGKEHDDLNDDFVALEKAGIEVRMLALSDFRPVDNTDREYAYGGGHTSHIWFWRSYGSYAASSAMPAGGPAPPATLSNAPSYRPSPRPTIFSSRTVGGLNGVGRQKPSGFGRVSLRTGGSSGAVSIGRSGSLGRSGSSFGG